MFLEGDYTAAQPDIIHLLEHVIPGDRGVNIVCLTTCVVRTNFTFFSRYFFKNLYIAFHNLTFKDSHLVTQNIALRFFNIVFEDCTLVDMPPLPGDQGEIHLLFSRCTLNSNIERQTTEIHFQHTFSSHISIQDSQMSNAKIVARNTAFLSFHSLFTQYSFSQLKFVDCGLCLVSVKNCTFSGSHSSSSILEISATKPQVDVQYCSFMDSSGAVYLTKTDSGLLPSWMQVVVENSVFSKNFKVGSGAALDILYFVPLMNRSRESFLKVQSTSFNGNLATKQGFTKSFGGAMHIDTQISETAYGDNQKRFFDAKVSMCKFLDNMATHGGGAIFVSSQFTETIVLDSVFSFQEIASKFPAGLFIHSESSISVKNALLIADAENHFSSLVELEMSSDQSLVKQLVMSVHCPPWQNLEIDEGFSVSEVSGDVILQKAIVSCLTCPAPWYVNSDGKFSVSYSNSQSPDIAITDSQNRSIHHDCTDCPTGAECPGDNLLAKPNFWGFNTRTGIVFLQCPVEYCCQKRPCVSYNECSGNRAGTLCGACKPGHSLSMLSKNCITNEQCSSHWFWFASLTGIFIYLFWYTFKSDVIRLPFFISDKIYQMIKKQQETNFQYTEKQYFAIMIFFAQVSAVMKLSNFQESDRKIDNIFQTMESYLGLILSIEISYISAPVCVSENMTTMRKTLFRVAFLFGIYLLWALLYFFSVIIVNILHTSYEKTHNVLQRFQRKLIFGLVEIIKYTYLGFTYLTFYSLTCVNIDLTNNMHGSTVESAVWFYDGTVKCYSRWQLAMAAFGLFYIIPYPFVLFFGLRSLKKLKLSRSFFLSVFFPVPVLIYWSVLSLSQQRKSSEKVVDDNLASNKAVVICDAFTAGYRESESGTQYWECVVMTRRFLICLTTFIPNPMIKLFVCLGMCMAFLLHHTHVKAFAHKTSNNSETLSLTLLVAVASINLLRASFMYLGVSPYGSQIELMKNLGLLESMFAFVLLLYILGAELLQKVMFQIKKVFVKTQQNEKSRGMNFIDTEDSTRF